MYHNCGKAINKHVEAERRTSPAARLQGHSVRTHRVFQSGSDKSEDIAGAAGSSATLISKRNLISRLKLDSAA
jgi:hypothetical protein